MEIVFGILFPIVVMCYIFAKENAEAHQRAEENGSAERGRLAKLVQEKERELLAQQIVTYRQETLRVLPSIEYQATPSAAASRHAKLDAMSIEELEGEILGWKLKGSHDFHAEFLLYKKKDEIVRK